MSVMKELANAAKVIVGITLNVLVAIIMFALITFVVKYALIFFFTIYEPSDATLVSLADNIAMVVSSIFFITYLLIAFVKFVIEHSFE